MEVVRAGVARHNAGFVNPHKAGDVGMLEASTPIAMTGNLSDLDLQTEYRSDSCDLVRDFYLPCLRRSKLYRRAVGYFTSRGLSVAAQGITALINGDGKMLLVASPLFDAEDLEAIEEGYVARHDAVARALLREIETTPDSIVKQRLGYLAWLVAEERLDVQIAVARDDHGNIRQGIYHEKLGIFSDNAGNAVAFTGSPNETAGGLVDNFESTDVFCSWRDAEGRVAKKIANFERLWTNQTSRLEVTPFPDAVLDQLLRYRPKSTPSEEPSIWSPHIASVSERGPDLWCHQAEAIEAWERSGRQGIISMATGSGKTRTALVAATRCERLALLVVAVPRSALVEQWRDELLRHTPFSKPVLAFESATQWQDALFNRLRAARRPAHLPPVVVVGTLASLSGDKFESVLRDGELTGNSLLIVDEVHNAGAPTYRRSLRSSFNLRLGLSATPARHFDEEGSQTIQDYFGGTVYTYSMKQALDNGHLCPYVYHVYAAHLTDAEYDDYQQLTRRIIQMRGASESALTERTDNTLDGDRPDVEQLLFRRARILKKCSAKIAALSHALDEHPMHRRLIYCADNEQLTDVTRLLASRRMVYLTYTADTPQPERSSALQSLAAGHVPVIVAIDCLDEGVDVPNVDEAIIIASSSNKRQFIQRRGRILRNAPGKSRATLVDIVALPPTNAGREGARMLRGELARIKEMAELAMNRHDALRRIKDFSAPYGVLLTELLSGEGDG